MPDIQIYNKGKNVFHRQNMDFDLAHKWLKEKEAKGKEIDKIDIQVFTWEFMPVDDVENLKTFAEAHEWLELFQRNLREKLYHRAGILR